MNASFSEWKIHTKFSLEKLFVGEKFRAFSEIINNVSWFYGNWESTMRMRHQTPFVHITAEH